MAKIKMIDYSHPALWIGWVVLSALLLIAICALCTGSIAWGMILLSLGLIYVGSDLVSIRDPNIGMVFSLNKLVGHVGPGFYLAFPFFSGIKGIEEDWKTVEVEGSTLIGGKNPARGKKVEETRLTFKIRVVYRPKLKSLKKVLTLMPEEAKTRIKESTLARFLNKLGKMDLNQIVAVQDMIEDEVLTELTDDFKKHGYEFSDVDLVEYEETAHVEANRIRIQGGAEAVVMKAKADAIATPLKGNNPAAWVAMAQELAGALVKAANAFAGRR